MSDVEGVLTYRVPYRVRFDEAGPDGLLRTSGLLRYAQDVAWQHSEANGLTRAWYADRGLAWLVRSARLEVAEPIPAGVTLEVTTRVVGYHRIWAQRRAEARLADGRIAAQVRTDWVMVDERGRLARIPPAIGERFPAPLLEEPILRVALPATPDDAWRRSFRVRPQELDPMNHPNNAVYVDWIDESLHTAGSEITPAPRVLHIEYAAAAAPGDEVTAAAWAVDGGCAVRLTAAGGSDLMRAIVGS